VVPFGGHRLKHIKFLHAFQVVEVFSAKVDCDFVAKVLVASQFLLFRVGLCKDSKVALLEASFYGSRYVSEWYTLEWNWNACTFGVSLEGQLGAGCF
jgi:hypothetical protein